MSRVMVVRTPGLLRYIDNPTIEQERAGDSGGSAFLDARGEPIIEAARNDAFSSEIVINGLAITDGLSDADAANLVGYYNDHIVTAADDDRPAGFVVQAKSFADFNDAVYLKVFSEITGETPGVVPEPGSLAIFGFSALCLGAMGSRQRRKKTKSASNVNE